MVEANDNTDAPVDETPQPESMIKITFPGGVHSTSLSIALSYVDPAQLELAGHFLVRQAESMYQQAAAMAQQQGRGIVVPMPGQIPQGLKV